MHRNVHERVIEAPMATVGALIDTLSSRDDRLWPRGDWPRMRMDRALSVGAIGGHGPVRYTVEEFQPGSSITFRFTGPSGFHGSHRFTAVEHSPHATTLRHELVITPTGVARITWPMFFRPLHDVVIEEAFDRAEHSAEAVRSAPTRRSAWVTLLRFLAAPGLRKKGTS